MNPSMELTASAPTKARFVASTDTDILAAVDNKQLRGWVMSSTPGRFIAYVRAQDLTKWRAANSSLEHQGIQ